MAIKNIKHFLNTFNWNKFASATHNEYQVIFFREYVDKKGILPDGLTLTLQVIHDDYDYGFNDKGEKILDNTLNQFDVTVFIRKPVQKGDLISLIGYDEDHTYYIDFNLILRFEDFEVLT